MIDVPQLKPVLSFLKHHPVMTIATTDETGDVCLATIYVYMDNDYKCHFVTRKDTRKFRNIQHHDQVVLSAYDARTLKCAELRGIATPVEAKTTAVRIMTELMQVTSKRSKACWLPPVSQIEGTEYIFIEVTLSTLRFYDYSICAGFEPKPLLVSFEDGSLTVSENYPY